MFNASKKGDQREKADKSNCGQGKYTDRLRDSLPTNHQCKKEYAHCRENGDSYYRLENCLEARDLHFWIMPLQDVGHYSAYDLTGLVKRPSLSLELN